MRKFTITSVALITAVIGVLVIVFVVVNAGVRYGLNWSFDSAITNQFGVLIGSIAGTLFTLTNALLLYSTLKAQRDATSKTNSQHQVMLKERNYDRIRGTFDSLEDQISKFSIVWGPQMSYLIGSGVPYNGYEGLSKVFELWTVDCTQANILAHLKRGSQLDPDRHLTEQIVVMSLMAQLEKLIADVELTELEARGREHLSSRLTTILILLAPSKHHLLLAAKQLRTIANEGLKDFPKQAYVSELLHIDRKIRGIAAMLPDTPYRFLLPLLNTTIHISPEKPIVHFTCSEIPTLQINTVKFITPDPRWLNRLNAQSIVVEITGYRTNGEELNHQRQLFSLGRLIFDHKGKEPLLDTQGLWFVEGELNLVSTTVEEHNRWSVALSIPDVALNETESFEIEVATNAQLNSFV